MRSLPVLLSFLFFLAMHFVSAQITVQNTLTPIEIVENILLGNGVTVSNIEWNSGTANAAVVQSGLGEFGGTPNTGIPNGVILSCGNISEAVGPNSNNGSSNNTGIDDYSNDADLQSLQPGGVNIHDAGVLEFDFIPSGDSISFKYIFASEEYPEFAPPNNSGFNDAFGFFLTGPNPSGGNYTAQNLAILPNGTTVSINNINPITNQTFYVDNANGASIEYDGLTTALTASAAVECGQTYHIKLGISDAGDRQMNSAVFLEASSFSSNAVEVAIITQTGDTTIIEGCADAEVFFIRPENDTLDTLTVQYLISGTAINGTDYTSLGTSLTFLPGEDSVSLVLNPLADAMNEGLESIIITAFTLNPCGDTIVSVGTLWIQEPYSEVSVNDITLPCPNPNGSWLVATPIAGLEPYSFLWSDGSTNDSLLVSTLISGVTNYTVTMTDACNEPATATATVTIQEYNAASFTADPITGQNPLTVNYTNSSSTNANSYVWNFGNGLTQTTATPTNVSTTFTEQGDFTTLLTVSNAEGCVDTMTMNINVFELPQISAPNVFTPDGDNINDVFEFFDYSNVASFECVITNRWGNVMHTMNAITDEWDGTINGQKVKEGTYFYTFIGVSSSGQEASGLGFFQLIR